MKSGLPDDVTIVIVNDFDYVQGGASKVAIDTARILHEKGYQVIFFSGTHNSKEYVDYGYTNITLDISECLKEKNKILGATRGLYNFYAKKEFSNILDNLDPNKTIIHVHGWTKTLSSSVFQIAFKKKFKVVLTMHDYFSACPNGGFFNYVANRICHLKPLSIKCVCTNCDSRNYCFKIYRVIRQLIQEKIVKLNKNLKHVIYISDFSYKILKPFFPDSVKFYKLYNPIYFTNKSVQNYSNEKYFLFVGRLSKEKGVEEFCEAISNLGYNAIVIGDGPLLETLKLKYSMITFLGWKNSKELSKYYQQSHVFVFSSLWYETAGLTVLEAAINNTYSLVADSTASKEFVEKYNIGELYNVENKKELEEKLKILYDSPKKDITKSIKKIKKNHDYNVYCDHLQSIYNSILRGGK